MEIEPASGSIKGGRNGSSYGGSEVEKSQGYGGGFERGDYLVWEDLRVVIPNFGKGPTKRLLNGLYGYAEPGRIMAIMGPSGSGKSTLLDSLAGFLYSFNFIYLFRYMFFRCS